ncbi:hypothetical protein BJX76DRAFT_345500 [Aspergillus varians]
MFFAKSLCHTNGFNLRSSKSETTSPAGFPAYFALYESIFCPSRRPSGFIQLHYPAISSHADVFECAKRLRLNPASTREELASTLSPNGSIVQSVKDNAIRSVIRVMFMLDCSLKDMYSPNFKVGDYSPTSWEASDSFVSYVERALPKQEGAFDAYKHKKNLKAWKLKKRYKLQFRPTDNITEHLLYDPLTRTVHVFHHTAYLKAHLRPSKDEPIDQQASESLKLGMLPPRLLLETLYTIHFILFPASNDPRGRSGKLLSSLIRKETFDPDAKFVEYIRDIPAQLQYQYWNVRLEQLYNVVRNPPPRNRFVSWVERHTSERNALAVAIIGLFLSALFGLLACVIGLAQLAVSVLAWKRPKEPS